MDTVVDLLATLHRRGQKSEALYDTRIRAHRFLHEFWEEAWDTARVRAASDRIIGLVEETRRLPGGGTPGELLRGVWTPLRLAVFQHGPRSPEVVAALRRGDELEGSPTSTILIQDLRRYGTTFRYPDAPFWYRPDGTPTASHGDTVPVPSAKATLVWLAGYNQGHDASGPGYYKDWAWLRRVMAKYGPQGLQLVIITQTRGYAKGTGTLEPEQEAPYIRAFWQDLQQLPATIAINVSPIRFFPAPDGRRCVMQTTWEKQMVAKGISLPAGGCNGRWIGPGSPWLLDANGKVTVPPIGWNTAVMELYIQRVLAGTEGR